MPRPAIYKPILIKDNDLRKRISEAGDSNFFDATTGNLYVRKSSFKKWNIHVLDDLWGDEGFVGEKAKAKAGIKLYFDFEVKKTPRGNYTQGLDRGGFYSMLNGVEAICKKNNVEHIVIRDIDDVDKPLGKFDIGLYIDVNKSVPGGKTGNNIRYYDYSFEYHTVAERRYKKDVIPGIFELGPTARPADVKAVNLENRKIIFNGFAYDTCYPELFYRMILHNLERCLALKDAKKLTLENILEGAVGSINVKCQERLTAITAQVDEKKGQINNYIDAIKIHVGVIAGFEAEKAGIKEVSIDEVKKYVGGFSIEGGVVQYTLTGFDIKGVALPPLTLIVNPKSLNIYPVDKTKKNPAPWLWYDEAKKDYTGVNNAIEIKPILDAAGMNVWAAIQAIKLLNERDYEKDYPGKTEAFIKENGVEAGKKA